MPVPPRTMFGAWEDDKFIGVVIFSRGANPQLGSPYGLEPSQCCELTRVALSQHESPVTKIVAAAIRALREHSPGLRLIISYADPYQGHHGGIYQAGNWVYTGATSSARSYVDRAGKTWHTRQVSESGFKRQFGEMRPVPRPSQLTRIDTPGKHRYLMPLDKAMRRQISKLALDYPPPLAVEGSEETRPATGRESRVRSPATAL